MNDLVKIGGRADQCELNKEPYYNVLSNVIFVEEGFVFDSLEEVKEKIVDI